MLNKFIHLKIHTEYSIIDSTIKINNLINKAKEFNYKSLAITDFMNFFGLIKFYESCFKNNIKPIIGINILVDHKDNFKITEATLLAKNNIGYKNLIYLISLSYKKNHFNKNFATISYELLIKYNEGLIILSGGIRGYIGKCILKKDKLNFYKYINLYLKYFNNRFYIEISRLGLLNEEYYIYKSIQISKKFSIPLVATNNVVFLNIEDFEIHKIRVDINKRINYSKFNIDHKKNQFFKNKEDMNKLFLDIPESIINTEEISKRCNVIIDFNLNQIPKFYKKINSSEDYLIHITKAKLKKKLYEIFPNYEERKKNENIYIIRLEKELNIINQMKFQGYFLIVMDFINWAKSNNIPVGPGRGSGAGSLVSYVLDITELDPIKYNLIFERFLNIKRLSMPDLDIDFCIEKRDIVINYVKDKYGKDNVSKIITFGTMTAKSVIKDVGRILGYSYSFVNKISKLMPNYPGLSLNESIKIKEISELYNNDEDVKHLINTSLKLEGIVKNIGKHAGGIVISLNKIINFVPLYYDETSNHSVTQFDKYDIEKIGLIKFDFLGLKTLTIINETIKNIKFNYNKDINISNIPLNDDKSFKMLKSSFTTGVFQLESKGIKELIKKLNPDKFEDIIDLIALFRPGPLKSGMVDNFINRKNGNEKIYYPSKSLEHESLKSILLSTYGIILYQEQIIEIAQKFSNYSLEEADLFRIAIGKKNKLEMNKQKEKFISGAIKNEISKKLAEKIFNIIEKFSGYGFNKSHSAAYALISYRTLWLKSNFKEEFMSSALNLDINNFYKINILIKECINLSIKINEININTSNYKFYVNNKKEIEFGIGAIKGIGESTISEIIKNRNKNGKFKNFLDFSIRLNLSKIGKKNLEILIKSGAFKILKIDIYNQNLLEKYFNISKKYFFIKNNKQTDMFGLLNII